MNGLVPISPLSLNQFTRDYWGSYDPAVIAQLAPLAEDACYTMKFYKAPADDQEVVPAYGYVTYGMRISPGSIIFGFYLPMVVNVESATASAPPQYTVQITDVSLEHSFWDLPVSSLMLSNFKPEFQSDVDENMGSFPNLLCAPYPVTGSGQFDIEIQETSGEQQRIEFVIGVLEVCNVG